MCYTNATLNNNYVGNNSFEGGLMKIQVENLTHSVTKDELIKLFEVWGEIESISVEKDEITGMPYGFVNMPNGHEAFEAIQSMQGVMLFGKGLKLCAVREEPNRRVSNEGRSLGDRRVIEERRITADSRAI